MVFHRGGASPNDASSAPLVASGATPPPPADTPPRCLFSVHNVVIIIATEAVAQFTTGEPVQNADDMLPLTSSAILMRLPVGVMFWKASLNALSSAVMTC